MGKKCGRITCIVLDWDHFDSWLVNVVEFAGCRSECHPVPLMFLGHWKTRSLSDSLQCWIEQNLVYVDTSDACDRMCKKTRKDYDGLRGEGGRGPVASSYHILPRFNPIFVQFIGFVRSFGVAFCRGNISVASSNFPWLYQAAPSGTLRYNPPCKEGVRSLYLFSSPWETKRRQTQSANH